MQPNKTVIFRKMKHPLSQILAINFD